jgi:hypothetical protein
MKMLGCIQFRVHERRTWKWLGLASVFFGVLFYSSLPALAAGGAISQSYTTNTTNLTAGALVSFVANGSSVVEPANSTTNVSNLVGIVGDKPLVELSGSNQDSVQVVVGGTTDALVSNTNGAVNVGDKITASPVSGIGMKAPGNSEIVGTAEASLSSVTTVTKSFEDKNGQMTSIKVGLLPIAVDVEYYAQPSISGALASAVPPFLQDIANSIAGKSVSPLKVLLATLALVLGFATTIVLVYSSVKNGFIAIGRNPLAASALRRGMFGIILAAIGILIVMSAAIFVILRT